MKKFITLIFIGILFCGCNGCDNGSNGLIGEVSDDETTIEINLKGTIGNRNIVIRDASGKSVNYTTVSSAPITSGTKTLLDVQLGPSVGVYNSYKEMDDVINSIAGIKLNYKNGTSTVSRVLYPDTNLFKSYTTFGKIDPTLLEVGRPYRAKLLKELEDNFNSDYQKYLNSDKITINQTKLLAEFRDKYTIVHQIAYGKDLVETNKYWISDENSKVQTLFDVGAVCPPVCP